MSRVVRFIMSLHDRFPAYGGRGPGDLRLGIALGTIATIFMVLRVYVRLRVNKFGTVALIWSLVAWVCLDSFQNTLDIVLRWHPRIVSNISAVIHGYYPNLRNLLGPSWPRKPYDAHYRSRPATQLPEIHMDHCFFLQLGHSHGEGGRGCLPD